MSDAWWVDFVLPIVMCVLGWIGNAYRNKQKREADMMTNFKIMRDSDKEFMLELKTELIESKKLRKRLEAKLDRKNKSIRKANSCPHTNEGGGCPVLIQEEKNEHCYGIDCTDCEHNNEKSAESYD